MVRRSQTELRAQKSKTSSADRSGQKPGGVDAREAENIEERSRLRAPVIYEIVRGEGETEMRRPITSLWWSGVAAGLSISFSLLAQGVLIAGLPDAPWRHLVASIGYSFGFLIVVLGRQQLFTENTITVVLPVIAQFNARNVRLLLRMWGIVFLANMAGTFLAALFFSHAPLVKPDVLDAMMGLSGQMMSNSWGMMLCKGMGAGFLVAAMVWIIPSAEGSSFFVIATITYLIAVGEFTHIVAGSAEAFLFFLNGHVTFLALVKDFAIPVALGNIIGGTALFAVIAYAQVMEEM